MYDTVIIGAGISGTSLAFELSKQEGKILLLDKENDVADGTTKANSAIIHAGYDPECGTLMARYNVEGNRIIPQICKDLDVPIKNIGSLVVAFCEEEIETLKAIYERGVNNGVKGMRIVDKNELHEMEPNLNEKAIAALYAPSACIVNPWDLAIAYAETAVKNGVEFQANKEVCAIKQTERGFIVYTQDGSQYETKTVVNAAGVECDKIMGLVRKVNYTISPNKGEYYLLDKNQGELVHHVIFQCPTKEGKGTLVAPTVHGNLIVGPSATSCDDEDFSTTQSGLDLVKKAALKSVPNINFRENIRTFAGIRARSDHGDFIVGEDPQIKGFFQIAAMQSPGLSSASAIAIDMVKRFQEKGLFLQPKANPVTTRKVVRFKEMSNEERENYIKEHPAYGRIICRCETISEGEILDALHRVITPVSIDGIKRRCNAGMGRCQGGFCGPKVQEIIAKELEITQEEVVQDKVGSVILYGKTKGGK